MLEYKLSEYKSEGCNQMNRNFEAVRVNWKFFSCILGTVFFWYIALFPGRLGYDYALAIRMIQKGDSTNWWTSLFFWFLRITTFGGKFIFIASLLGICALAYSIYYFIFSLPINSSTRRKAFIVILFTPFFGVFGVTVSHDVFQTAGIILLVAIELRFLLQKTIETRHLYIMCIVAYTCLLTTQTGIFFIVISLVTLLIRKKGKIAMLLTFFVIIALLFSSIGISTDFMRNVKYYPILADLKCIAQHPEARISPAEWDFLTKISPKEYWLESKSCSSIGTVETMPLNVTLIGPNKYFMQNYFGIISRNPAIFMMAHIQRSRGALPPPFFQGPENQVDLDVSNPIGLNTNIALQIGPELLHPSIDEPSVDLNIAILKPIEFLAQIPTFLVNQASWFWGWGGFWFWPIMFFWLKNFTGYKISRRFFTLYPLYILHLLLFILNPGALGRYYMSTILIGIIISIILVINFVDNQNKILENR